MFLRVPPFAAVMMVLAWNTTIAQTTINPEHSFQKLREEGVDHLVTTGGPMYHGELFTYEKILEIQGDPTRPESMLFKPTAITCDDNGTYYIVDSGDLSVAIYDTNGTYLRSLGGRGQGPGEFEAIDLAGIEDNIITLFDYKLLRFSTFDSDGTLIRVTRADVSTRAFLAYLMTDNTVIALSERLEVEGQDVYSRQTLTVNKPDQNPITIEGARSVIGYTLNEGRTHMYMYYVPTPSMSIAPNGRVLMTTGEKPEILCYNWDGVLTVIRFHLEVERVTSDDRRAVLDNTDYDQMPPRLWEQYRNIKFPRSKAFWNNITTDDRGFIWLTREAEYNLQNPATIPRTLVVDREGRLLGSTRLPVLISQIRRGFLMGISQDPDTGELLPVVYRILPIAPGLDYPQ